MGLIEMLKAILFGIVEGVTEWLPVSSTGHMILLKSFMSLNVTEEFWKMFEVVIQFGAIMAVVVLFWNKLWPFYIKEANSYSSKKISWKKGSLDMWLKIFVACIPAAVVGLLFDDKIDALFYHPIPVAIALIVVGVVFIIVENTRGRKKPVISSISEISYKAALIIGMFQLVAAVFPGTSRSGATIVGALMIGVSRAVSAEFTFFLAVPVMFGASLLKIMKYIATGAAFTGVELSFLLLGTVTAFIVSVFIIKFLIGYIKKHDFKVFGWYRIALGVIVLFVLR